MQACLVCEKSTSNIHMHHTVPQCRGGKHSQQIPLCGDCHTVLHAHALHVFTAIKNNRRSTKSYWSNPQHEERAMPFVGIIVNAFMMPIQSGEPSKHPILTTVDGETMLLLKRLKQDIGASSIDATLRYCILKTCERQGIKNEQTQGNSAMWFLPASGTHKAPK